MPRLALLLLAALPAKPLDLAIAYPALERMVTANMFPNGGKRYVQGSEKDRCKWAYLEDPHVEAADGRLRIRARFTGKTAMNFLGACVGPSDRFEVAVYGNLYYRDGALGLKDIEVKSPGRDGFYVRRVREALTSGMAREFHYPLKDDVDRMFRNASTGLPVKNSVTRFGVNAIRVEPQSLVLALDVQLSVQ